MTMTSSVKQAFAAGIVVIGLFLNSFINFLQNRQPANPYDVFQRDLAFFECAALLTFVIGYVLIWYRREMLKPEAQDDPFFKQLFAVIFVALVVSLAGYTYWKIERYWVSAAECRCGDLEILIHTKQEYMALSAVREAAPLAVLLIATVIHPALGSAVSVVVFLLAVSSFLSAPGGERETYTTFKQLFPMFEGLLSMLFFFFNLVTFFPE